MTQQERDLLRVKAWDKYRIAQEELRTIRNRFTGWAERFETMCGICRMDPDEIKCVIWEEGIPAKDVFEQAVQEMREAVNNYRHTREQAESYGFIVGEDETFGAPSPTRLSSARLFSLTSGYPTPT